jgi:hypothetical protein
MSFAVCCPQCGWAGRRKDFTKGCPECRHLSLVPRQSEADFQRQVIELATRLGWWCWHDADSRKNRAGLPDLILVKRRVVWAELKVPPNGLTADQAACVERLRAAGEEVYVWRPSDWPAIERALR